MNSKSVERQLQAIIPPPADDSARERARQAALTEFRRIHRVEARQAPAARWSWKSPWLGGFATAAVAVVGVALFLRLPEEARQIQLPPSVEWEAPQSAAGEPAVVTTASEPSPGQAQTAAPEREASVPRGRTIADPQPAPPVEIAPAPPSAETGSTEAKSDPERLMEIEVTGSRIVAAGNAASPSQLRTFTLEEMRRLGMVNVADQVSPLPQNITVYTGNPVSTAGTAGRSLTMVNGRVLNPLPAPLAGDRFEEFDSNPVKSVAEEPVSTFSIDVDTASYSYARRLLNQGRLPPADAVRVEEMINYFDYQWPAPASRREPLRTTIAVSDSPWKADNKLIHVAIQGYDLPARGQPDVNLVMLVDVSGSMNEPDKLPLAIRSLQLLLDTLKPTDTVAIVVYAGAAGQVLPPTPVSERRAIERALEELRAGGSTAGAQGIRLAYQLAQQNFRKEGVNRILLATDGDFNVGLSNPDELRELVERERGNGIYLSVLGFGEGNYQDQTAQTLAQNGNGVAVYIDSLDEARKVLVKEATSAMFTIASDVKIQVEFNPAAVAEYRLVGYETRALQREDFNNDRVDAGEVGSGHTVTAIYEVTPADAAARGIDERRYGVNERAAARPGDRADEYGFVKIRYKLPGESRSRLMEQPIRLNAGVPESLRQDVAFSTAVAGFGQLLRGSVHTGELRFEDVIRQARSALGNDEYGHRAEFVQLARKAREIQSPLCGFIFSLDERLAVEKRQIAWLLQRFSEAHPEVVAARARLTNTEASRTVEVARAVTRGVECGER